MIAVMFVDQAKRQGRQGNFFQMAVPSDIQTEAYGQY